MKHRILSLMLMLSLLLGGCARSVPEGAPAESESAAESAAAVSAVEVVGEESAEMSAEESTVEAEDETPDGSSQPTEEENQQPQEDVSETLSYIIAIDPGHQGHGNADKEPIGPGASEKKAKVTSGTSGKASGLAEYELTLTVGLQLRDELESRGYTVVMTRTTHDVDISNAQRAAIANEAQADAFVRIHANGSEDSSVHGAMTICQTESNPYNGKLHDRSKALATAVLEHFVAETDCKREYVWETDTMSGINWCEVPATIVEMGYMSNKEEDLRMADSGYQAKMVKGIADGIEAFLTEGE